MISSIVNIVNENNVVETELKQLTNVLIEEIPSLLDVRVFGSYNNGNWDEKKSDIDLLVLLNDEDYYSKKDVKRCLDYNIVESELRRSLRERIKEKLTGEYSDRFSLYLCTPTDIANLSLFALSRGNLGENMIEGRLIYKK